MSKNNFWQLVFTQSKVNGAAYFGDRLPTHSWDWPKDTFLQRRLNELKKRPLETQTTSSGTHPAPIFSVHRSRRNAHHDDATLAA
jgi:hypothetical protein